jgi:hypothetical protein
MRSDATTPAAYLSSLPPDRRKALAKVRTVIRSNLPAGIREAMAWGMITYQVPLASYPNTYNGHPLAYAAVASQKNYMSVYLMGIYASDELRTWFEETYRATGKRMDVGKSCVRFRTLAELPLEVIGSAIGALTLEQFVQLHAHTSLRLAKKQRSVR